MHKRRIWALIAGPGLAVTSLLLVFLLLGRSAVSATLDGDDAVPDLRSPGATFTVSGTVTCEATGAIADVEVFVWDRDEGTGGFTAGFADSSGHFSITLPQGTYDLLFHPPCGSGCASRAYKGITGPPDVTLNTILSLGHSVSGTVFATDGSTPVDNVAIYAFNHDTADGFGLPPTDENGYYCISLITGTYDLGFTPPPCLELGPKTVVTTVNQNMSLDVILPPGFTVGGCVTDEATNSVPGVQIYAKDPNIGGFGFAPTNESGCYTGTLPLAGSPPTGVYDIQFIPPPGLGLGSVTEIDVVSETAGCPNTTLPITLPAGYTLSGRVTCNRKGIKNTFVYALPEGPHDRDNSLPGYGVFTVDDGSYGLPLVPGTYVLTFTPPAATMLNAKAFTTTQLVTDTVLDVDFCVCRGVWVTETVDSGEDVGLWTSLALAPTYPYTPHVSYSHFITAEDFDLKYAWWSGTNWLSQTVDHRGGERTSIALVPTYPHTPCISYRDFWGSDFRYVCRHGTTWTIMTVVGGIRASPGGMALEPIDPYTPHISYRNTQSTLLNLGHAYLSGTTWCSGTWVREGVEPLLSDTGSNSSLALETAYPYTPHISYNDQGTDQDLKHAWKSGTTWLSGTVDSEGDVGLYNSLALDSSGDPHISYFDDTNDYLKYAWLSGTVWVSETVDGIGQPPYNRGRSSLELDHTDTPYISYYDAINGDLKLARFDGRVWIIHTADSTGDVGQFSSLALDQLGCPHVSYYDATSGDLKYAYIPPPYLMYLPLVMRNHIDHRR